MISRIAAIALFIGLAAAFLVVAGPGGVVPGGAQQMLAQVGGAVGVTVGVLPNSFNTVTQQLQQKERELDTREQQLDQRAQQLNTSSAATAGAGDRRVYGLAAFSAVLFLILLLSFYFDHRRAAGRSPGA